MCRPRRRRDNRAIINTVALLTNVRRIKKMSSPKPFFVASGRHNLSPTKTCVRACVPRSRLCKLYNVAGDVHKSFYLFSSSPKKDTAFSFKMIISKIEKIIIKTSTRRILIIILGNAPLSVAHTVRHALRRFFHNFAFTSPVQKKKKNCSARQPYARRRSTQSALKSNHDAFLSESRDDRFRDGITVFFEKRTADRLPFGIVEYSERNRRRRTL